jgi:hypothetical protein
MAKKRWLGNHARRITDAQSDRARGETRCEFEDLLLLPKPLLDAELLAMGIDPDALAARGAEFVRRCKLEIGVSLLLQGLASASETP